MKILCLLFSRRCQILSKVEDMTSEHYCKKMSDRHLISSVIHQIFFLALFPRERKWCKWNNPRGAACCNLRLSLKNGWTSKPQVFYLAALTTFLEGYVAPSSGLNSWLWYHHKSTFGEVKMFLLSTVVSFSPGEQPTSVRKCSWNHTVCPFTNRGSNSLQ